ncbi:endonuclease III [bacterium]
METKQRIIKIIAILKKEYPDTSTILNHRNPFQLLVATVLSAQCTDKRVNMVTPKLFKKYKSVKAFAGAQQSELEEDIRAIGFFRNKAKNIIGFSKLLLEKFHSKVPDTMDELLELPGAARKTANIILTQVFGKAEGIAVDTHVARISQKLKLTKNKDPKKIEYDLLNIIPKKDWLHFNSYLVNHGRAICVARRPKCGECKIARYCPSRATLVL